MSFLGILLEIALKSSAIVVICGAVSLLLRKRSAIWENRLWRICLWGVIVTPFSTYADNLMPAQPPVTYFAVSNVRFGTTPDHLRLNLAVDRSASVPAAGFDWDRLAMIVYVIGAVLVTAWLMLGLIRVRRIVRRSTVFAPPGVLASDEIASPATVGDLRPVILLPTEARDWDAESIGAAILHEETHIRRRDWSWQMFGQTVRALFWFNPFVWLMVAALRQSGERAYDDQVVESGYEAAAYAKQLLAIVSHARSAPETVVAIVRKGGLKSRLQRILTPGYPFRPTAKPIAVGLTALFAAASFAMGLIAIAFSQHSKRPHAEFFGPAKLSDGSFTRVVSVRSLEVGQSVWTPNGNPTVDPNSPFIVWTNDVVPVGYDLYAIHFEANVDGDSIFFRPEPTSRLWHLWPGNAPSSHFAGILARKGVDNIDLQVGFCLQPFKLYAEDGLNRGATNPTPEIDHKAYTVPRFRDSFITFRGLNVRLQIPDALRRMQLHAAVVTTTGQVIYDFELAEPGPETDGNATWFHFPQLKSAVGVKSVRLFARPIEWVDFTGIHLKPNRAK